MFGSDLSGFPLFGVVVAAGFLILVSLIVFPWRRGDDDPHRAHGTFVFSVIFVSLFLALLTGFGLVRTLVDLATASGQTVMPVYTPAPASPLPGGIPSGVPMPHGVPGSVGGTQMPSGMPRIAYPSSQPGFTNLFPDGERRLLGQEAIWWAAFLTGSLAVLGFYAGRGRIFAGEKDPGVQALVRTYGHASMLFGLLAMVVGAAVAVGGIGSLILRSANSFPQFQGNEGLSQLVSGLALLLASALIFRYHHDLASRSGPNPPEASEVG